MNKYLKASLVLATAALVSTSAFAADSKKKEYGPELRTEGSSDFYSTIEPAAGNPDRVMRLDREQVQSLQRALQEKGYGPGRIDGLYGLNTSRALQNFQRDNNLEANGQPTNETLLELGFTPEARFMSRDDPDREYGPEQRTEGSASLYSTIEPAAGDPDRVMRLDREQVSSVQKALQNKGYRPGQIDGLYGVRTSRALRDFQRDNDLAINGQPTNETLLKLGFTPKARFMNRDNTDSDMNMETDMEQNRY